MKDSPQALVAYEMGVHEAMNFSTLLALELFSLSLSLSHTHTHCLSLSLSIK